MKVTRRTGKSELPQPKRPATPRPLPRHRPPPRAAPPRSRHVPTPDLPPPSLPSGDESLRNWFEEEAETLQRLAHTQRMKGNYVGAQSLEREIRVLASETAALIQAGGADLPG